MPLDQKFVYHQGMKTPNSSRHRIFLILELKSSQDKRIALLFSWLLTLLVLSNVASVILESVPDIHSGHRHARSGEAPSGVLTMALLTDSVASAFAKRVRTQAL